MRLPLTPPGAPPGLVSQWKEHQTRACQTCTRTLKIKFKKSTSVPATPCTARKQLQLVLLGAQVSILLPYPSLPTPPSITVFSCCLDNGLPRVHRTSATEAMPPHVGTTLSAMRRCAESRVTERHCFSHRHVTPFRAERHTSCTSAFPPS